MTVEVRLFATLRKHLPPGSGRSSARIEVPVGASIGEVVGRLGIPLATAFLVLVDGRYEGDRGRRLEEGCVVSIFPPIAGG